MSHRVSHRGILLGRGLRPHEGEIMGFEYRLHVDPPLADLGSACEAVFATSDWQRIPTALLEVPAAIGGQCGETPADPSWPQVADLYLESERVIFVVAHINNGGRFVHALIAHLESSGYCIAVDDV